MVTTLFNTLPPELLLKICDSVEPEDYLCMRLSCKSFAPYMTKSLSTILKERPSTHVPREGYGYHYPVDTVPTPKERFKFIMARTEGLVLRDKPAKTGRKRTVLPSLLCTGCCKIKDRKQFSDTESGRHLLRWGGTGRARHALAFREKRMCISCGENGYRKTPSTKASVKINGELHFVCVVCSEPHLMEVGVHLRDGHLKACVTCADAYGMDYTKANHGAPCGYVVYDEWTDVRELVNDYNQGAVPNSVTAGKYEHFGKGYRKAKLIIARHKAQNGGSNVEQPVLDDDEEGGEEGDEEDGQNEGEVSEDEE